MSEEKTAENSPEFAEAEFDRFADVMGLDIDPASMGDEDKAGFEEAKRKFVKAIQRGDLVVGENGAPVYTPVWSENQRPITFIPPIGSHLASMDRTKVGADMQKTFNLLGEITDMPQTVFRKMRMPDLNVCLAVMTLFLG